MSDESVSPWYRVIPKHLGVRSLLLPMERWLRTQVWLSPQIGATCYQFYQSQPSKLSGEHYYFYEGRDLEVGHAYNIGRPETIETLFYLWRKTKDPIYREWGWDIFQAFQKQCRTASGYTGLQDVSGIGFGESMLETFCWFLFAAWRLRVGTGDVAGCHLAATGCKRGLGFRDPP